MTGVAEITVSHVQPSAGVSPFPQKSRERNRLTVGSRGSSPELTGGADCTAENAMIKQLTGTDQSVGR